ncbi:DUF2069 domain-containing protein [Pseudomonas sp. MTM4]|uniref:DUF2069 domain-containing protein n=1 Tax=unclassified Pseudomonas TaxID=196821 RepID=UPI00103EC9AB|nr:MULTISPECIES: DUF2069 domain-containing protein [unclassified Pseudomonas]MBC8651660.1 DUF2069 domain-containing protein [Pseudomonas sp. MT4]QXY91314.1 DUF2069 domain-containing protein [Pseudomonas sp. MTM4]TCD21252.1 DUF2069 domain-containing protein [Pseudomonas sp. IC_126]
MARKPKPLPSLEWLAPRLKFSRVLSLASFISLAALLIVWNLAFADLHGARTWVVISIQLIPLLLVAPGMISGSPRAHAWTCFIVNLYFIQGVLAAINPARMVYGWLEAIISLTLFISALLYTRWAYQYERKAAGES